MRIRLLVPALFALALFTTSPAAMAHGSGSSTATAGEKAARLIRAADTFDRKATGMRTRATNLRTTALDLRHEAEELAGGGNAPTTTTQSTGKHGQWEDFDEDADICVGSEDDADASGMSRHRPPHPQPGSAGDVADDGTTDDDGEDDASDPAAEICELLTLAAKLESRAAELDVAAGRLAGHATILRAKAAKLLQEGGATEAERLLAKAKQLRAQAAQQRATADQLRDDSFEGADVDDAVITRIQRLERSAARLDLAAGRLEAKAASLAGSVQ